MNGPAFFSNNHLKGLFVLSVLLVAIESWALNPANTLVAPTVDFQQPNRVTGNGWVLDSVLAFNGTGSLFSGQYYRYDSEGRTIEESTYNAYPSWRGYNRTQRVYDDRDNVISETTYTWDTGTNGWLPSNKYTTTYGLDNVQQLDYVFYTWVNGAWLGQYKQERVYENGNQVSEVTFGWDTLAGEWVPASKTHYEMVGDQLESCMSNWDPTNKTWLLFNKSRNVTVNDGPAGFVTTQTEEWTSVNQFWTPRYRWSVRFDSFGNQTESVQSTYDTSTGVGRWVVTNHSEATWAAAGKQTSFMDSTQSYQTGLLEPFRKTRIEYDDRFNVTLQEVYQWQSWNGGWSGQYKQVQAYDANDRVINRENYTWMAATSSWQGSLKYETTYAPNGLPEESTIYSWYQSDPVGWAPQNKTRVTYNSANKETLLESYTWGGESNQVWLPYRQVISTFDIAFNRVAGHTWQWNSSTSAWKETARDTATYDAYNNVTYEQQYELDTKTQAFKSKNSKRYYYSKVNTGLEEIALDKATTESVCWTEKGRLHLVNDQPSTLVQVFALDGRLVVRKRLNEAGASFELPKGMYLVVLGTKWAKVLVP